MNCIASYGLTLLSLSLGSFLQVFQANSLPHMWLLKAVLRWSAGFPRQAFLKLNWDYRIANLGSQLQFKINSVLSSMLPILTFTLKWYKLLYQSLPGEPVVMRLSGT